MTLIGHIWSKGAAMNVLDQLINDVKAEQCSLSREERQAAACRDRVAAVNGGVMMVRWMGAH